MLVLCRRVGEGLLIGDQFRVELVGVRRGCAHLNFIALDVAAEPQLPARHRDGLLWCKEGERVSIGSLIQVTPMLVRRSGTRIGIEAPDEIRISRIPAQQQGAAA